MTGVKIGDGGGMGLAVMRDMREARVPADADKYFGKAMRAAAQNTRLKRAQALKVWFAFLELRHKAEIYQLTGYVAECQRW